MLSFNTRSILDLNKRMKFANCMLNLSYDLICVCETWLTEDVKNASIFLENYEVYRNDRTVTASRKSKHGGVLIAVSNRIAHEPIRMKCPKADYLVVKIEQKKEVSSYVLSTMHLSPVSINGHTTSYQASSRKLTISNLLSNQVAVT